MRMTNDSGSVGRRGRPVEVRAAAEPQQAVTAEVLRAGAQALAATDAPRVTAEALLAHLLGLSRTQLLARLDQPVAAGTRAAYEQAVGRAAAGEPLAYLTGRREFHGLEFQVDARVLVPRPETELLADLALKFAAERCSLAEPGAAPLRVADVGTGSGVLAVTLAVKCGRAQILAVDLSAEALEVARANAARHAVLDRVAFVQGDLLSCAARGSCDVMVANLPYIPSARLAGLPVARYEPAVALDGGPDGLTLVRRLLASAPQIMAPGGDVLLEIESTLGEAVMALAQAAFPAARVRRHMDLAGLDRVIEVRL
jgi:release factor glutamine methyltransferase